MAKPNGKLVFSSLGSAAPTCLPCREGGQAESGTMGKAEREGAVPLREANERDRAMISTEMIEAAAMAIREVAGNRSGRGKDWDRIPEAVKADYRREARAALRAVGMT
jgi:hypothetical protein